MPVKVFKSISRTAKLVGCLTIAAIAVGYFFAYTATGISWILNANLNDPSAKISIDDVSREIDGNTVVSNLKYQSATSEIFFEKITLNWNPLSIFSSQLLITALSGHNLTVNIKSHQNDSSSISLDFPVAARVEAAVIDNLTIKTNDRPVYSISETTIDNIFLDKDFFAEKIKLKTGVNKWVTLSGRFGFSTNSVINLTTEANYKLIPELDTLHAHGTVVGNIVQLRFLQHVDLPLTAKVNGRIKHLFSDPSWEIDTRLQETEIVSDSAGYSIKNLSGNILIAGDTKSFQISSNLTFEDKNVNNWLAKLEATSKESDINFNLNVSNKDVKQQSHLKLTGAYKLKSLQENSTIAQGLKLKANWKNLKVNLIENNPIAAKAGAIEFDGETFSSKLTAHDIQLEKLGPTITKLVLNTSNSTHGELSFNGKASTSGGNLNLSGRMTKQYNKYKLDTLFLTGHNFPLVRKPHAHIIISPDLSFVRRDHAMTSMGSVKIPTANIQLQDFRETLSQITSLITVSKNQLMSSSSVDVEFGKAVWIHGYGLNAHVTGDLSLQELSNKHITASGELKVLRGNYQRLREKLQLKGGLLKFDNHHIDNPQLDLKIVNRQSITKQDNKIIGRLQKLFTDSNKSLEAKPLKNTTEHRDSKDKVALNYRQ